MSLVKLLQDLTANKNLPRAKIMQKFFKTGPGEYGAGDIFWGITVPQQRQIAAQYSELSFFDLQKLLASRVHEQRLTALIILTLKYKQALPPKQKIIYSFYLKNINQVNNWDLVDITAPGIVGNFLFTKNRGILYQLVKSKNLWKRRIAIVSTLYFIKQNDFQDTLKLAMILLHDKHDLIHKAVGWMLREAGKKDLAILIKFLDKNCRQMPRVMLRYAIERLPEKQRRYYLQAK